MAFVPEAQALAMIWQGAEMPSASCASMIGFCGV